MSLPPIPDVPIMLWADNKGFIVRVNPPLEPGEVEIDLDEHTRPTRPMSAVEVFDVLDADFGGL